MLDAKLADDFAARIPNRAMEEFVEARGKLSREESTRVIRRVTSELASLAETAAAQAAVVLRNGRRALPKAISGRVRGKLARAESFDKGDFFEGTKEAEA